MAGNLIQKNHYRGNELLKRPGISYEYTKETVLEVSRCQDDYLYFMKNYCQIVSLDGGLIKFDMFDFQEKFVNTIHENRFTIGMMPRQQSKTTCVAAYILWYILFNEYKTIGILAHKHPAAREVLDRIKSMYELLPKWLQDGVVVWNKGSIELENHSKIFTAATTASSCRGKSVSLLYIDEAAFIQNDLWDEFWAATYPTVSSGSDTKVIISSTPKGYNSFWKIWKGAEEKTNGFVKFLSRWQEHPKRDQAWADKQLEALKEVGFAQEVECSFVGSSFTLVSGHVIHAMVPSKNIFSNDGLDVLEYAKNDHTYVLVADTSKGVGGDYSAFTVVDITELPFTIVAKYRNNNISPLLYPTAIYNVAKRYNEAYVLIEINSSEQVAEILFGEMEYENILQVIKGKRGGQVVTYGFGTGKAQLGVNTDKKVKRIGCANLKSLIEENKILISDADIIAELSTFIEKRGTYSADTGYHDDLVMTLVLFSWLTTQNYFKTLTDDNLRKKMYLNRMIEIENHTLPIGHFITGNEPITLNTTIAGDYWVVKETPDFR